MYSLKKNLRKSLFKSAAFLMLLVGFLIFLNSTQLFKNIGYKAIKPNQSIELEVQPKTEQLEYYSTLIIDNPKGVRLKLTTDKNKHYWHDLTSDVFYDTVEKEEVELVTIGNEVVEKKSSITRDDSVSFEKDDFVIQFKGEKSFDVTNNKNFKVKIENLSNQTAKLAVSINNN